MNTVATIPVTRVVNAVTRAGHAAVELGAAGFTVAAATVHRRSDMLQNDMLNRITVGRAARLQAPLQTAVEGAVNLLPAAMATGHEGVRIAGLAGKQFGWSANNVIRATGAATRAEAEAKIDLAARQYEQGMDRVQDLQDLVGARAALAAG